MVSCSVFDRPGTRSAFGPDAMDSVHMGNSPGGMGDVVECCAWAGWHMAGNGVLEVESSKADKGMVPHKALRRLEHMALAWDTSCFAQLDTVFGHTVTDDPVVHRTCCPYSLEREIHIWVLASQSFVWN